MSNVADALQGDLNNIQNKEVSKWENTSETNEIVLPFEIRSQFRPKLMEFFEMTNKRHGAYLWAEQKTKDYFETALGIPQKAWVYRTRHSG